LAHVSVKTRDKGSFFVTASTPNFSHRRHITTTKRGNLNERAGFVGLKGREFSIGFETTSTVEVDEIIANERID